MKILPELTFNMPSTEFCKIILKFTTERKDQLLKYFLSNVFLEKTIEEIINEFPFLETFPFKIPKGNELNKFIEFLNQNAVNRCISYS